MSKKRHHPPGEAEFAGQLRSRLAEIPNCEVVQSVVLTPGPAAYKVAALLEFKDPASGKPTRVELHLNDYPFRVYSGVRWAVKDRLGHWECNGEELERLRAFLAAEPLALSPSGGEAAEPRPGASSQGLAALVAGLSFPDLVRLVAALAQRTGQLRTIPAGGPPDPRQAIAASLRAAHRMTALANLRQLIDRAAAAADFEKLLASNGWMLGGRYAERIDARPWIETAGPAMIFKTAGRDFDLVVLQSSGVPLFEQRAGRWTLSPAARDALTLVGDCLGQLTCPESEFLSNWCADPSRLSAKLVAGYVDDADPQAQEKRRALETFNAHLRGIEVIPYDALVRVSEEVIHANLLEAGEGKPSVGGEGLEPTTFGM